MSYYADQLREFFAHDVTDCAADYIEKLESQVTELESQLAEAKKGAERYEIIRKLHPHEFANLWRKNIGGEGLFDDLVDAAIKENQQ